MKNFISTASLSNAGRGNGKFSAVHSLCQTRRLRWVQVSAVERVYQLSASQQWLPYVSRRHYQKFCWSCVGRYMTSMWLLMRLQAASKATSATEKSLITQQQQHQQQQHTCFHNRSAPDVLQHIQLRLHYADLNVVQQVTCEFVVAF